MRQPTLDVSESVPTAASHGTVATLKENDSRIYVDVPYHILQRMFGVPQTHRFKEFWHGPSDITFCYEVISTEDRDDS